MRSSSQHIFCLAILLLVLGLQPPAHGQTDPAQSDSGANSPDLKSKAIARGLSFGATAATAGVGVSAVRNQNHRRGLILIGSGLLFGPSAGLLYAEAPGRALRGIGIRASIGAGSALLTVGSAVVVESREGSWAALGTLVVGVLGGTGLILAHGLYESFGVSAQAVEAHNASVREAASRSRSPSTSVSVQPWASPRSGTPGLQVRVLF
jgi:hypothetical protein